MMAMRKASFVVTLLLMMTAATAQEKDEMQALQTPGNTSLFISRTGARLRLYKNLPSNGKTGEIRISFEELNELDAAGNQLPDGQHSYKNLATQAFNSRGLNTGYTLPHSTGVLATCLDFATTLPASNSQILVTGCIVKNNGSLLLDNENSSISVGQVKFTVSVLNWTFSSSGSFLELKMDVKVPNGRELNQESDGPSAARRPRKISLGAGAAAIFSRKVFVDGVWLDVLPSEYPMLQKTGSHNYVILRFPKFSFNASYDPTIDSGSEVDTTTPMPLTPGPGPMAAASSFGCSLLTLALLNCLVFLLQWNWSAGNE